MKIAHYSYDDVNNPRCGGGGAFRELMIHTILGTRHTVFYYTGTFKGATPHTEHGVTFRHIGFSSNYLISRITFCIAATIHSVFVKADVIVVGYSVFSPVLTFLFRNSKTIIEFYHCTGNEPFKKYSLFGVFPWLAERIALYFGRNFITLTDSMADFINSRYKNKYAVPAYTGYDTSINSECRDHDNYVLYFGRIDVRMKGIDILIDAFEKISSEFPEMKLRIAGRGSDKDTTWLENRITQSCNSTRISFIRNASQSEKHTLFHHATFLCMPSRFEGWCISAIEAGASNKAVIGTEIMGLRDSIKKNETGLLVPPENSIALAEAMRLLLQNQELREKLGRAGSAWAQHFTWEKVTQLQENAYCRVCGK